MVIEEPKKVERFGLVNIGNTCYMNASIQFLKSVPAIDRMIRQLKLTQVLAASLSRITGRRPSVALWPEW